MSFITSSCQTNSCFFGLGIFNCNEDSVRKPIELINRQLNQSTNTNTEVNGSPKRIEIGDAKQLIIQFLNPTQPNNYNN